MLKAAKWCGVVLILVLLFWAFGCAEKLGSDYKPQVTELGINVKSQFPADLEAIDRKTLELEACLIKNGWPVRKDYHNLTVLILCDRKCDTGKIDCDIYYGRKDNEYVHGWADLAFNTLATTPNLASYKHELVHWHGYSEGKGGNEHPVFKAHCE